MKKWQSILISIGLLIGAGYANNIKDEAVKNAALAGITALGGYVAKKTSEANPDGTKAETPYQSPAKKRDDNAVMQ